MINAVLVFNNVGQPRLTKFYTQLDTAVQQRLISEIYTLVSNRPFSACNFLPLPPLLAPPPSTTSTHTSDPSNPSSSHSHSHSTSTPGSSQQQQPPQQSDAPTLITYRRYATLYFILISTSTESPLALIDLIRVFVEALDRFFENVCELDLIFNFETLHAVLGEMIVGGVVVETGLEKIVKGVREQGGIKKRGAEDGGGGGGVGGGLAAGMKGLGGLGGVGAGALGGWGWGLGGGGRGR